MQSEIFKKVFLDGENNPYLPKFPPSVEKIEESIINSETLHSDIDKEKCKELYNLFFRKSFANLSSAFGYEKSFRIVPLPGVAKFEKKNYHLPTLLIALKTAKCIDDNKKIIVNLTRATNLSLLVSYLKELGASITDKERFGDICVFRKSDSADAYCKKWLSVLHNKSLCTIGLAKAACAPLQNFDCAILADEINAMDSSKSGKYNPENNNITLRAFQEKAQLLSISYVFTNQSDKTSKLLSSLPVINPSENANMINISNARGDEKGEFIQNSRLPSLAFSHLQEACKAGPCLVLISSKTGKRGAKETQNWFRKAFQDIPILISARGIDEKLIKSVDKKPQIIISTLGSQPIPKAGWKAVYIMDAINFLNFQNSSNQKSATARIVNSWMEAFSHIEILPHEKASENNKPSAFIINSIPESILFSLQKWNTKSLDVAKNALDKDLQNAFQELQNAI